MFNFFLTIGQEMSNENKKIISDFIDCVKNSNTVKLSEKVSYPFRREYPIAKIKNKQEFIKRYNELFDATLIKKIATSNPSTDWSKMGWRGFMLLNGVVWLDYDGKLIAVNYQSEYEAKTRLHLINAEKNNLHESLKEFKQPICILETAKFRIRIDEMNNGNYRYASWGLNNKMADKPDLIINNGTFIREGTGGNHTYEFKNGNYKYHCSIIVLGEKNTPPARLTIYNNENVILTQKALLKN